MADFDLNGISDEDMTQYMNEIKIKERLFDELRSGNGIQGLIEVAYEELQNPIFICDTSFSILNSCPQFESIADFQTCNHKKYMKPEAVSSMTKENLIQRITIEKKPFVVYKKEFGVEMMYYQIAIQHKIAGYICVTSENRPFSQADKTTLTHLSQMLSLEMQKSSFYTEKSGFNDEYLLADLFEGYLTDETLIRQRLLPNTKRSCQHFFVFAAVFTHSHTTNIHPNYYREQLLSILPESLIFIHQNCFIGLLLSGSSKPYDAPTKIKLESFLTLNQMKLTLSYSYSALMETPAYYAQVKRLLNLKASGKADTILCYEEYMLCSLISTHDPADQEAMIHPDIKLLKAFDLENHTNYYETLKAYLNNRRNAVKSAASLNIHKSTFFYRMGKITELLQIDLNDCHKLFKYEISICIDEAIG